MLECAPGAILTKTGPKAIDRANVELGELALLLI